MRQYGIQRVKTGVQELDEALEGGVPKGSWVAITGEPGTGKSILCMHYAFKGLQEGDPVIYVTTEAEFRDVVRQAEQFDMYFEDYEIHYLGGEPPIRRPNIVVVDIFSLLKTARQLSSDYVEAERRRRFAALDIETLIAAITNAYEVLGVVSEGRKTPTRHVRLVIDSLSAFWADKPAMARRYSYQLKIATHRENVTAFLVSQYAMTTKSLAPYDEVVIKVSESVERVEIGELMREATSIDAPYVAMVNPGIEALSYDVTRNELTWGLVRAILKHPSDDYLYSVEVKDCGEVHLTKDHTVYAVENGAVQLKSPTDLKPGSEVVIGGLGQLRKGKVTKVHEYRSDCKYVYDLSVDRYQNFIAGTAGLVVHNSTFGFGLEHIADGVIHLWMDNVEEVKEVRRYLIIKKMRMTNHYARAFKLYIVPRKGVVLEKI